MRGGAAWADCKLCVNAFAERLRLECDKVNLVLRGRLTEDLAVAVSWAADVFARRMASDALRYIAGNAALSLSAWVERRAPMWLGEQVVGIQGALAAAARDAWGATLEWDGELSPQDVARLAALKVDGLVLRDGLHAMERRLVEELGMGRRDAWARYRSGVSGVVTRFQSEAWAAERARFWVLWRAAVGR